MPRWFLFTLMAIACWGVWAVLSKLLGEAVTAAQSQALSTLGLLPVMLVLAYGVRKQKTGSQKETEGTKSGPSEARPEDTRTNQRSESTLPSALFPSFLSVKESGTAGNRRRGILNAFLAGALTCAGNVAYYHALNSGAKAATVVPFTALYPLVTIVLAVLFLRERLNAIQLGGIGLSLVAIVAFNIASVAGVVNEWLLFALLPIGLWGVSGLLQKLSTNDISGERSTLWFLLAFVPVSGLLLLAQPVTGSLAPRIWLLVAALGLFFSLGNYAILRAFASAGKASLIAPLASLYPVVSVPIAIGFLGERITPRETLGIALALVAVAALAWERPAKDSC